jgi:hypothetical protein
VPDRPGDMDERDVDARFASIVAQWEHSAVDESDAVAPAGAPVTDDSPADPAAGPESAAGSASSSNSAVPGDSADGPPQDADQSESAGPEAPPAPRDPWVQPLPLNLIIGVGLNPEPRTRATERAAADAEETLRRAIAAEEPRRAPEVTLPPQEDLGFWCRHRPGRRAAHAAFYVVFAPVPQHPVVRGVGRRLTARLRPARAAPARTPRPLSGDDGARI